MQQYMLSLFTHYYFSEHLHEQTMIKCAEILEKHAKNMNQGFRFRHTYNENEGNCSSS